MNAQHWLAFLWLRWRLLANQWHRGGRVNFVLMMILAGVAFASLVFYGLYKDMFRRGT